MRTALRVAAMIIGVIGALDALVINLVVSAFKRAQEILGGTADPSHGFIGLLICLVGLAGALLVLRSPLAGGILLILAGIAFFLIAHWWALLASPQLIVAGALALMDRNRNLAGQDQPMRESKGRMPAPTA